MKKIIILGGEGDGLLLASALEDLRDAGADILPLGFLSDAHEKGKMISDLPVLDVTANAHRFLADPNIHFITALLKVKESQKRSQKIKGLPIPAERYFTLIHPQATVSRRARIGHGSFVGPHATVMPNATVGAHCSLRVSCNVDHDCVVEDYCFMGPNSTLAGRVTLREGAHIGANACVRERLEIGAHCVIGMGSVVLHCIPPFSIAYGNPARWGRNNRSSCLIPNGA